MQRVVDLHTLTEVPGSDTSLLPAEVRRIQLSPPSPLPAEAIEARMALRFVLWEPNDPVAQAAQLSAADLIMVLHEQRISLSTRPHAMIDPVAFSTWASDQEPMLTYVVLMAATVMEYLVPILPSELVPTLLAVVHAASERHAPPGPRRSAGSTLGGMIDYAVGRYMVSTSHDTWLHRLFRRPAIARWVETPHTLRKARHVVYFIEQVQAANPTGPLCRRRNLQAPVGRVLLSAFVSASLGSCRRRHRHHARAPA